MLCVNVHTRNMSILGCWWWWLVYDDYLLYGGVAFTSYVYTLTHPYKASVWRKRKKNGSYIVVRVRVSSSSSSPSSFFLLISLFYMLCFLLYLCWKTPVTHTNNNDHMCMWVGAGGSCKNDLIIMGCWISRERYAHRRKKKIICEMDWTTLNI